MAVLPPGASPRHTQLHAELLALDQGHLFAHWPEGAEAGAEKRRFLAQVEGLEASLPGGLRGYYDSALVLLRDSRDGVNPFEGYTPRVPEGETLPFDDDARFEATEEAGLAEFRWAAVVLVAGGLGERLGYSGIKLELPIDLVTGMSYLEYYCRWLQAIEDRLRLPPGAIPFVIMTSDDTHAKTLALLEAQRHFGLPEGQLTLVKQEAVPALGDNAAHFVLCDDDPYRLLTKPQGHGVVHTLLHQAGLVARWRAAGKRWVTFLQDTNTPNFRTLIPSLGVSAARGLAVNSVATAFRPGEAIGAICRLDHPTKPPLTINVEYNQFGPLLAAAGKADVPGPDGFSLYPGNVNLLIFALEPYAEVLNASGGQVPNFVNPKYADEARNVFKKPTRLECMMQDLPRLLPPHCAVGFTRFDVRALSMSPCKNSTADGLAKQAAGLFPDTAAFAEHHSYRLQAMYLRRVGVHVEALPEAPAFAGISVAPDPHISLLPSFAVTRAEMRRRFKAGPHRISASSTLVLEGDVEVERLELDGALVVRAAPGAAVRVAALA
eukprot:EG_transcript_8564